jgi:hypothetical protein
MVQWLLLIHFGTPLCDSTPINASSTETHYELIVDEKLKFKKVPFWLLIL